MNFTKEEMQKLVEEVKKIRLGELKVSEILAVSHPITAERQKIIRTIKRRQNEVKKFVSLLKRKINNLKTN